MIELEVNIQKHSVKVKVSDLNFSCLQKLKAKKKKFLHGLYAGICLAISEFQKLINKNKYLTMKYLTSSI